MATQGCPCGYLGDERRRCRCTPDQVARYRGRISGPLRDRLDLSVHVAPVPVMAMLEAQPGEATVLVRDRVCTARAAQQARYEGVARTNAELNGAAVARFCRPDVASRDLLRAATDRLGLSARGYDRVLKVARTIADLAGADSVAAEHVAEALQYRLVE